MAADGAREKRARKKVVPKSMVLTAEAGEPQRVLGAWLLLAHVRGMCIGVAHTLGEEVLHFVAANCGCVAASFGT
eukprot:11887270-Prorocentrum_lima.AAC.1